MEDVSFCFGALTFWFFVVKKINTFLRAALLWNQEFKPSEAMKNLVVDYFELFLYCNRPSRGVFFSVLINILLEIFKVTNSIYVTGVLGLRSKLMIKT